MNPKPLTVLFLSSGNAARSIVAEAIMRHIGGGRFFARSAGLRPLPEMHRQTLEILQAEGIDTDGLHTKNMSEFLVASHLLKVDVIVTLSEDARQNCPAWPGDPVRVHWTVDDPLAADKGDVREWKFKKCMAVLESRITSLIKSRIAASQAELLLQLKHAAMVV